MVEQRDDLIANLRRFNFFALLPQNQFNEIIPYVSFKKVTYGQSFPLVQNDKKRIFGVFHGTIKIVEIDPSGTEVFRQIAFSDDFVGVVTSNEDTYAHVLSIDAILFTIKASDYNKWVHGNPNILELHKKMLDTSIRAMQDWFNSMLSLDVKDRVLFLIRTIAQKEGGQSNKLKSIERRLTQSEMASLLFTSRQSIVRSIHALDKDGVVNFNRKNIELLQ